MLNIAKVELHHASKNKNYAGENKVFQSINQATAHWAYCVLHTRHSALSVCIDCFYSESLVAKEFS